MERERTHWPAIALLIAVGIAAALQFAKIAPVLTDVQSAYDIAETVAAALLSAPAIVGIVLGLTASIFVARLGFRRVLIACLGVAVALSGIQALLPALPVFALTRVLEGVAHLGIVISCPVLIMLLSARRHASLAMGLWGTFFGLAFAVAGAVAPTVRTRWGLGAVFGGHALVLAVLLLIVLVALPRVSGDGPQRAGEGPGFIRAHLAAYRSPRAVLPGAVFIFHTTMYTALVTFVPEFADPHAAGILLVWMPLVSIVGTVAAGALAQFVTTPPVVLLIGYVGVGVCIGVAATQLATGGSILVAPLILMFFSGLIQGASFALIPALSTSAEVASRANGVLTQLGNLGSSIGPPLFAAAIVAAGGFGAVCGLVVVLCIAGGVTVLFALRLTGTGPRR